MKKAMKSTGAAGAASPMKKAMKAKPEKQHPSISALGYIKYMTTAKKATEEEKQAAIVAVETYEGLPRDKKKSFIERFNDNRGDKRFKWVKDFSESVTKIHTTARSEIARHRTRRVTFGIR